jgi:hypothetical protein
MYSHGTHCTMLVEHTRLHLQASAAMASQGSGKGGKNPAGAAWTSSQQHRSTLPVHRAAPPAGCGKGIDFHSAASSSITDVPHLASLVDTPNAWLANGEMLMVRWPPHMNISKAFPPPGAMDNLTDLKDELAVMGASFTMRGERKRRNVDGNSYHMLRTVGPPGTVVQIYRRLRTVAGVFVKSFKGLPPVNRPRVFAVNEDGHANDHQGLLNRQDNSIDETNPESGLTEVLSDDEYADKVEQGYNYRASHQLSLAPGEVDVALNNAEFTTGRKSCEQGDVLDIARDMKPNFDDGG